MIQNFFKRFIWMILGGTIVLSGTVLAVQVSVPSGNGAGFLLQSLSTGNYGAVSLIAGSNVTIATTTTSITISSSGSGGSGNVSTSSVPVIGNLSFWTTTTATPALLGTVGTTTLTASSPLSLSNPVVKVGGSNSVLTIDTTGAWSGSAGSVINALTAGTGLTSAGTYNGATARTFSLDTANANTWTALQTFTNSSTTLGSFSYASSTTLFGANLQTCNSTTGKLTYDSTLGIFGCGTDFNTGGAGGIADPFTHPAAGQSATTSLMLLYGNASTTGFSSNYGFFGGTATTSFSSTGVVTLGTTTAGCLQNNASGVVWSATCAGGGSVTSIVLGDGLMGVPSTITTSGTIYGQVSTATLPVLGQVPYWATLGTVNSPAKLSGVATSSIASGVGITVTNGSTAFVLGAQPSVACNTATASVFGCLSASDFSKFNSATTTFGSGYATTTRGTLTFSTTTSITNGLTSALTIVPTAGALTFTPSLSGTLTTAGGGTGLSNPGALGTDALLIFNGSNGATAASVGATGCVVGSLDGSSYTNCLATIAGGNAGGSSLTFQGTSGTTNMFLNSSGNTGIGTTTPSPIAKVTIATTTTPHLSLSAGTGLAQWVFRNAGGDFFLSTTSVSGISTTTKAAFSITNSGQYSISTSTAGNLAVNTNGLIYSTPAGAGTVTSVGLSLPSFFTVTNSPVTTTGTLTGTIAFARNAIITADSAGTNLIATGTQLTVGNILATTTAVNWFNGALVVPDGTCSTPSFSFSDDQNNGITSPANDVFTICTNALERMRIDDGSGKSMFGTTTQPLSTILTLGSSTAPQLTLSSNTGGIAQWAIRSVGNNLYFSTTTTDGTATTSTAALSIAGTGAPFLSVGTTSATSLGNNIAAFAGSLFVGRSQGSISLANSTSTFDGNVRIIGTLQTGAGSMYMDTTSVHSGDGTVNVSTGGSTLPGTIVFPSLSTDGTIGIAGSLCLSSGNALIKLTGAGTCVVSTRKEKHDIKELTLSALDMINQLKPSSFTYNRTGSNQWGFIAEELAEVSPKLATYDDTGQPFSIDLPALIALNTKAIQELAQAKGFAPIKRSVEENWQWIVIGLLVLWNIGLTIKRKKYE